MQLVGYPISVKQGEEGGHWAVWGCEAAGTTVLLCAVVLAIHSVFVSEANLSAAHHDLQARWLFVGIVAGGTGAVFAHSPWGCRSGAHLNPAVSFAFWLRGQLPTHDLMGYSVAQLCGSVVGVVLARWIGGGSIARPPVRYGLLTPSSQWSWWQAGLGETLMTSVLIWLIFLCLSRPALRRWTAWVAGLTIALCIWLAGPYTGAGLNPARSFGPAMLSGVYGEMLFYAIFPLLGSLCAAVLWQVGGNHRLLFRKAMHDATSVTRMAKGVESSLPEK